MSNGAKYDYAIATMSLADVLRMAAADSQIADIANELADENTADAFAATVAPKRNAN